MLPSPSQQAAATASGLLRHAGGNARPYDTLLSAVDDAALLAIDLDGLVAAASPLASPAAARGQHTGLTPEQKDKVAQNLAKAKARRRARLNMNGRSDGKSASAAMALPSPSRQAAQPAAAAHGSDDDEPDSDDPDGSIAALFASEPERNKRCSRGVAGTDGVACGGAVGGRGGGKRPKLSLIEATDQAMYAAMRAKRQAGNRAAQLPDDTVSEGSPPTDDEDDTDL